jgi:hypothetical protein
VGTLPLSYQWLKDGTNIIGATNSSYLRPYVLPADSGTYAVVVTNHFGGVTSSNAILQVNVPLNVTSAPLLRLARILGNSVSITWDSVAGQQYQLQFKTNLSQANWINLGPIITAINTQTTASEALSASGKRFYCVTLVQSIDLTPTKATLKVGTNLQFTVAVQPTNQPVIWSVNDVIGGNGTLGTITTNGFYTTPAAIPANNPVTVKGARASSPSNYATATVTIIPSFTVTIDFTTGLITFPNKYSGWQLAGGQPLNYVAYPSGWSVGGGQPLNYIAVPPGWSVGGGQPLNYVAVPPGWSVGGGQPLNYVAVPPGWSVGGGQPLNYVAVPPGGYAGGGQPLNYVSVPAGWSVGGGQPLNYIALPPRWSVGGGQPLNYVGLAPGWSAGGGQPLNYVSVPPGWSVGGGQPLNYVAVAPGWVVGGGQPLNYVTYPGGGVTTIQITFNDPGFLGLFQSLQNSGLYLDSDLADIVMAAHLNTQPFFLLECSPYTGVYPSELAPSGQW